MAVHQNIAVLTVGQTLLCAVCFDCGPDTSLCSLFWLWARHFSVQFVLTVGQTLLCAVCFECGPDTSLCSLFWLWARNFSVQFVFTVGQTFLCLFWLWVRHFSVQFVLTVDQTLFCAVCFYLISSLFSKLLFSFSLIPFFIFVTSSPFLLIPCFLFPLLVFLKVRHEWWTVERDLQ